METNKQTTEGQNEKKKDAAPAKRDRKIALFTIFGSLLAVLAFIWRALVEPRESWRDWTLIVLLAVSAFLFFIIFVLRMVVFVKETKG